MHGLTSTPPLPQPWGQWKRVMCVGHGRKGLSLGLTRPAAPAPGWLAAPGWGGPGALAWKDLALCPALSPGRAGAQADSPGRRGRGGRREGPKGVGGAWLRLAFLCGC